MLRKVTITLLLMITGLFLCLVNGALATDTFIMTFANIRAVDSEGAEHTLLENQSIDLRNVGESGQSLSVNPLPAGSYSHLRANITSVTVNGAEKLTEIEYNSGQEFSNIPLPTSPFVITGGGTDLILNIFTRFGDDGIPLGPPLFTVKSQGAPAASELGATVNGTFSEVGGASTLLYYGFFTDFGREPLIAGRAANNGDETGTFTAIVPAGTYYVGGFEDVDGSGARTGPNDGDNIFFNASGTEPAQVVLSTGETESVTLTKVFSYNASDQSTRAGGGGASQTGNGSVTLALQASPEAELSLATKIYVGVFMGSEPLQEGAFPDRVVSIPVLAETFTSTTDAISNLPYGSYRFGAVLDIGADLDGAVGPAYPDWMGMLGGMGGPPVQVNAANPSVDLTGTPIILTRMQEGQ